MARFLTYLITVDLNNDFRDLFIRAARKMPRQNRGRYRIAAVKREVSGNKETLMFSVVVLSESEFFDGFLYNALKFATEEEKQLVLRSSGIPLQNIEANQKDGQRDGVEWIAWLAALKKFITAELLVETK